MLTLRSLRSPESAMSKPSARSHRCRSAWSLAAAILLVHFSSAIAWGEVLIAGDASAVRVEARDATAAEVLDALSSAFGLRFKSTPEITKPISGTYEGALVRVITRILEGYDNVIQVSGDTLAVTIYNANQGRTAVSSRSMRESLPRNLPSLEELRRRSKVVGAAASN
jgi:hypothetical protein